MAKATYTPWHQVVTLRDDLRSDQSRKGEHFMSQLLLNLEVPLS